MAGNANVEEYLEALYKLAETGGCPVTTTQVAETVGVSPASVSEMFRRLADQGMVDYVPYRGACLTARGRVEGARILRNHRLWERFLVDVLGMEWDQVHEEACRLEHATSARVARKLSSFLDEPETCPHGYAVPAPATAEGESNGRRAPASPPAALLRLSEATPGLEGQVVAIDEDPDLLRHCARVGLTPGARFRITDRRQIDLVVELALLDVGSRVDAAGEDPPGLGREPVPLIVGPGVGERVLVTRHVQ